MRKAIALVLCMLITLAGISSTLAEAIDSTVEAATAGPIGIQRGTELTVGSFTPLSGSFFSEMWGNNTADIDVRTLLHGYETVSWTLDLGLEINTMVVTDIQASTGANLEQVYTIEIKEDLYYCDGTPITAKDYIFSLLLSGAPEAAAIGGTTQNLSYLMGYDEYNAGTVRALAGVRLLSDNCFSMSIQPDYLPYFYGLMLLGVRPFPISVIAPGCDIYDDGEGVYIGAAPEAGTLDAEALGFAPGVFSAEMLKQTLLDPDQGYVFYPRVTSGPYSLVSYDPVENVATFKVNEYYKGNNDGQKPRIERLVFRYIPEEKMFEEMAQGHVDVLNKVMSSDLVTQCRAMQSDGSGMLLQSYLRSGFGFLAFACEREPVSSAAVRKAVAMSFDKDAFIERALPGTAVRSYGYYGAGQWMATYENEEAGYPQSAVMTELEALDVPMDLEGARSLLEKDGWLLNADGAPFAEGRDTVRYRERDGALEPLVIRWATTEGDPVTDELISALTEALPALGIQLEVTVLSFSDLLKHYYRQVEREYDMFFLASNFGFIYDPYYDFNTADAYQGMMNTSGLRNEELMERARDMRETEQMDMPAYIDKWLEFQHAFVEQMPMIPLYSNVYFDITTTALKDYYIMKHLNWPTAIIYAYIEAP